MGRMSKEVVLQIRALPDFKKKCEAVAAEVGLTLSAWVRVTLAAACGLPTVTLTAVDPTPANTTIKVSSLPAKPQRGAPVLKVDRERQRDEATVEGTLGHRAVPPPGLKNSDLQAWLRKNRG